MTDYLKSDKQLEQDISRGTTREDLYAAIQSYADRARTVEQPRDSGGRFVSPDNAGERKFSRTVEIGGMLQPFEATSEEELNLMISAAQQAVENIVKAQQEPSPTAEEVEAERQRQLAEQTQRDLDLAAGRISMKDYIEQSGVLEQYLENRGVSVDALRQQVEERQSASMISAWQRATDAFLKSSDWPGTERNKQLLLQQLQIMGLEDSPSVESLEAAYGAMKAAGTIFPGEQGEAEILDSLVKSRFGKTVAEASPAELLEVYKQQMEGAASGDATRANQEFLNAFRRK